MNNATLADNVTSFTVFCSGQIEWCEMVGKDNLYCRYVVVAGKDWECIEVVAPCTCFRASALTFV